MAFSKTSIQLVTQSYDTESNIAHGPVTAGERAILDMLRALYIQQHELETARQQDVLNLEERLRQIQSNQP